MWARWTRWCEERGVPIGVIYVVLAILAMVGLAYGCQGLRGWAEREGGLVDREMQRMERELLGQTPERTVGRFCEGLLSADIEAEEMLAVYRLSVDEVDGAERRILSLVSKAIEEDGRFSDADTVEIVRECREVVSRR